MKKLRILTVLIASALAFNICALVANAAEKEVCFKKNIVLTESDYQTLLANGYNSKEEIDAVLSSANRSTGITDYAIQVMSTDPAAPNSNDTYWVKAMFLYNGNALTYYGVTTGPSYVGNMATSAGSLGDMQYIYKSCNYTPGGIIMYAKFSHTDLNETPDMSGMIAQMKKNNSYYAPSHATVYSSIPVGDFDNDGSVTIADQLMLTYFITEDPNYNYSNCNMLAADVNLDGFVNMYDTYQLQQYLTGYSNHVWGYEP